MVTSWIVRRTMSRFRGGRLDVRLLGLRPYGGILFRYAVLYVITFGVVLPVVCRDWGFSLYYGVDEEEMKNRLVKENELRSIQASEYLRTLDANASLTRHRKQQQQQQQQQQQPPLESMDIVIGVVSVSRHAARTSLDYLTQVMASLDKHTKASSDLILPRVAIFICNVDSRAHPEAEKLSLLFPVISRFKENHVVSNTLTDNYEKEKQDYEFCLNQGLRYDAKYVLLVEDDAVAHEYLLPVLHRSLFSPKTGLHHRHDWAFLKLYYPDKWRGFSNDIRSAIELTSIGAIVGAFFVAVTSRRSAPKFSRSIAFLVGVTYGILSAVLLGRPYMFAWRRLFVSTHMVTSARGCCTQATLYPSTVIPRIISSLDAVVCSKHALHVDIALDNFAADNGYRTFAVEPNLFQHIGIYSVLRHSVKKLAEFLG